MIPFKQGSTLDYFASRECIGQDPPLEVLLHRLPITIHQPVSQWPFRQRLQYLGPFRPCDVNPCSIEAVLSGVN